MARSFARAGEKCPPQGQKNPLMSLAEKPDDPLMDAVGINRPGVSRTSDRRWWLALSHRADQPGTTTRSPGDQEARVGRPRRCH